MWGRLAHNVELTWPCWTYMGCDAGKVCTLGNAPEGLTTCTWPGTCCCCGRYMICWFCCRKNSINVIIYCVVLLLHIMLYLRCGKGVQLLSRWGQAECETEQRLECTLINPAPVMGTTNVVCPVSSASHGENIMLLFSLQYLHHHVVLSPTYAMHSTPPYVSLFSPPSQTLGTLFLGATRGTRLTILPFHSQEWSISNFLRSLSRNIILCRMKNLAFHHFYSNDRWLYYQFSLPHYKTYYMYL